MAEHHHDHGHTGHAHATLDAYPIAVLVHLSGPRRGVTERIAGEYLTLGSHVDADICLGDPDPDADPGIRAALVCRGETYELVAEPGRSVWVNGLESGRALLRSEDLIEVGRGGPMIRFRLYPPGSPGYKSAAEAFRDCVECARHAEGGAIGSAGAFATALPREIVTQTSRWFRTVMVFALLTLTVATLTLARRSATLERRLQEELDRVAGLTELMDRRQRESLDLTDFELLRSEIDARLSDATGRIGVLESRSTDVAAIVADAAPSVVFIQGLYAFRDPRSGRWLRLMLDRAGTPVRNAQGQPSLTLEGNGPILEIPYTGTGFVVDDGPERLLMTNRHVALPWEFDEGAVGILQRGFEGVMRRFRGFFPDDADPVDLVTVSASDDADVAVVRASRLPAGASALPLGPRAPAAGEEVVVLGYPLGIRALVARTDPDALAELQAAGQTGFWDVADALAGRGGIRPLASGGIVGQVTDARVVYDAETTSGGSGGPVLDTSGRVVAVNAAVLPDFGGSNMGVPVGFARALLRPAR